MADATPLYWHWLFEALAYGVGFRYFSALRRHCAATHPLSGDSGWTIVVGAILGAALGSKFLFWLHNPAFAFAQFPNPYALMGGKTVVGGFLGGLIGVEIAKYAAGIQQSSGDLLVGPLALGLAIGRIGCFLSGMHDDTHGSPTDVWWGYDYGDGIPRHPAQLYEIAFILLLARLLLPRPWPRVGDRFALFLSAYLLFRLLVDFLKPAPMLYLNSVSGIQLACMAGLAYYSPRLWRIAGELGCQRR